MRQALWGTFLICGSAGSWADPALPARFSLVLETVAMVARARRTRAIQGSSPKRPVCALKSQQPAHGPGLWASQTHLNMGHHCHSRSFLDGKEPAVVLIWLKTFHPPPQKTKKKNNMLEAAETTDGCEAAQWQDASSAPTALRQDLWSPLLVTKPQPSSHARYSQPLLLFMKGNDYKKPYLNKIFLLLILNLPSPSSTEHFAAFAFIFKGSDPGLLGGRRPLGFTSLCNLLKLPLLCFKAWLDLRVCRSISLLAV